MGKLSEEKRQQIIKAYKAGMTVKEICKAECVSDPTVRKLIKRHLEILQGENPAERVEQMANHLHAEQMALLETQADKEKKATEHTDPANTEGLSYGERKAAEMSPSYHPQRVTAPTNTSSNPFLGKRGHIDGTNPPPKDDDKPHGLLFRYSKELEALNLSADPEHPGDDAGDPEDSGEDPDAARPLQERPSSLTALYIRKC